MFKIDHEIIKRKRDLPIDEQLDQTCPNCCTIGYKLLHVNPNDPIRQYKDDAILFNEANNIINNTESPAIESTDKIRKSEFITAENTPEKGIDDNIDEIQEDVADRKLILLTN